MAADSRGDDHSVYPGDDPQIPEAPEGQPHPRVVLATRNAHKVAELSRILADAGFAGELVGLDAFPDAPEVAETGSTFADNALLKARAIAAYTGLPAVSDDSGLTVNALNGMPGILSARWSGKHGDDRANLELVLGQLADIDNRDAAFVCVAALALPDGSREWTTTGVLPGQPHPGAARRERLRLRPDLRPGRPADDHRGARPAGQGRDQPPRPRLPGNSQSHRGVVIRSSVSAAGSKSKSKAGVPAHGTRPEP